MNFANKLRTLTVFFSIAFFAILVRLFYWQIISAEKLSVQADKEHFYSLSVPAKRGEILFDDGLPLVSDKDAYLMFVNLQKFSGDKKAVSEKLAEIFAASGPLVGSSSASLSETDKAELAKMQKDSWEEEFWHRLNLENVVWVNLSHFVSQGVKDQVEKLHVSGLGFTSEQARDYPEASMAAHTVGFVGLDKNGEPKGYFGLEGFYDRELSGSPGELRLEKDALGRPIPIGEEEKVDKRDGHSLVTTLDRSVQLFVERELSSGITDWKATGGTAVVLDPTNGEIKALASFPDYDPANFSLYPTKLYKNPAVSDIFEPGSIIKPLVMAAAINEGKLNPETLCTACNGPRQIGQDFIHTFNGQYHPNSTMTDVLVNSDNTGMVFVGERLGFGKLYSYLQKYGFSEKTGVDLEEEEAGSLRDAASFYPIDQATLTFGQGIAVSSLQMVRAFAVLANGGNLATPHLVSKIITDHGEVNLSFPRGRRILSDDTTKTVSEMLVRVANESPEHFPKDRIPELSQFRIAAKSGTAQIAVGGKYAQHGTTASLIGYFPAEKPRFLIYVKLNEPEVRPWGSDTAGPVFFAIVRDLINYYGLTP